MVLLLLQLQWLLLVPPLQLHLQLPLQLLHSAELLLLLLLSACELDSIAAPGCVGLLS